MTVREIACEGPGYEGALALRYRILREPLGVEWTDEELAWERRERHFVILDQDELIGVVVARPLDEGRVKFRQMAVAPQRQKRGIGRELLEGVEKVLAAEGTTSFELHARDHATGFYERLGYRLVGEPFLEVGILHRRMEKCCK